MAWGDPLNANADALDALAGIGALAVTPYDTPTSQSLNVRVTAGNYRKADGTVGSYGGVAQFPVPPNATTRLWLTDAGALVSGSAFPATAHVRLASVLAGPATITGVSDQRVYPTTCGTPWPDGTNIALGTGTGTRIGTAANQKLGLFGTTPTVQPTGGAMTAGASYGTNEQTMLQTMWNALRALGALS